MKHAILIMGHSNPEGIKYIVNALQDKRIDFYVHWDKSSKIILKNVLETNILEKITLISPVKVYWGGSTQILAQLKLLSAASKKKYDYYHMISDMDIPVMDVDTFKDFFDKNNGTEYIGFSADDDSRFGWEARIKYYYPFENYELNRAVKKVLEQVGIVVQKVFRINRLKNTSLIIKKGPSWYSVTDKVVEYILSEKGTIENVFGKSSKADEIYMQTLVWNNKMLKDRLSDGDEHGSALRYIDWDRGNPYTFSELDVEEVESIFNTNYAFLRKIDIEKEALIKKRIKSCS